MSWYSLPNEMRLAVLELLDITDAKSCSRINKFTYQLSLPILFKSVNLLSHDALLRFLESVPSVYFRHIRSLRVHSSSTNPLITLLSNATNLNSLHLRLDNSLSHHIIPFFARLSNLNHLSISNVADEALAPISERLVVAIAATVPALTSIHLDRISRSLLHAPDLKDAYPTVPVVVAGDQSIPDHPVLGSALCLPSLLRIPSLRSLSIQDTHLGDPLWSTTTPLCTLTSLDIGCCSHASPASNSLFAHSILSTLSTALSSLTLSAPLDSTPSPLPALTHLTLTPFFCPDSITSTLTALSLAAKPLARLSVHAFPDDFPDTCATLSDLLAARLDRDNALLPALSHLSFSVVPLPDPLLPSGIDTKPDPVAPTHELTSAARTLLDFSHDLALTTTLSGLTPGDHHGVQHPDKQPIISYGHGQDRTPCPSDQAHSHSDLHRRSRR